MPTECPFPFAFTFSELTFMNAIHELGQLLISALHSAFNQIEKKTTNGLCIKPGTVGKIKNFKN